MTLADDVNLEEFVVAKERALRIGAGRQTLREQ